MNYPELSEIRYRVKSAINELIENDRFLLDNDVNERSISHRLAVYLEHQFKEWNVDCEYNRDHKRVKTLKLPKNNSKFDCTDTDAKTVYPDIIIHKRGEMDNLLVIEIKKSTNQQEKDINFDKKKLKAYRDELGYKHILFLIISTDGEKIPDPYTCKWDDDIFF